MLTEWCSGFAAVGPQFLQLRKPLVDPLIPLDFVCLWLRPHLRAEAYAEGGGAQPGGTATDPAIHPSGRTALGGSCHRAGGSGCERIAKQNQPGLGHPLPAFPIIFFCAFCIFLH